MARRVIGGLLLVMALMVDVVAVQATLNLATIPMPGIGSGPREAYRTMEFYADGRAYEVVTNGLTGTLIARTLVRPWSWERQLDIWWPVIAGFCFTVTTAWFVRRQAWMALWRFVWPPRSNLSGWMIVVAISGGECGVLVAWMRAFGASLETADAPGILICVAAWNLLALLPVGIALSYRTAPADRDGVADRPAPLPRT